MDEKSLQEDLESLGSTSSLAKPVKKSYWETKGSVVTRQNEMSLDDS